MHYSMSEIDFLLSPSDIDMGHRTNDRNSKHLKCINLNARFLQIAPKVTTTNMEFINLCIEN